MPLEAGSKPQNILKSIDAFVQSNIETGLSQTVYYMYQHIPAALDQPVRWVVMTLIDLGQVGSVKIAGENSHSAQTEYVLTFNLYEKAETNLSETTRYTLATLAADIAGVFPLGLDIPVHDYDASGTPQHGGLGVRGFPSIVADDSLAAEGIRQMTVNVPLGLNAVTISS